jgi:hypothetical protein
MGSALTQNDNSAVMQTKKQTNDDQQSYSRPTMTNDANALLLIQNDHQWQDSLLPSWCNHYMACGLDYYSSSICLASFGPSTLHILIILPLPLEPGLTTTIVFSSL